MADTGTAPAAPPAGKKKLLGLPRPVAIAGLAALAALGYVWWRGRSGKGGGSSTSTAQTVTEDEIAALAAELDQLLAAQSGGGGGGGGGQPTSPGTGGTTAKPVRAPSGTHTAAITANSARLSWQKIQSATSYRLQVHHGSDMIHNSPVSSLSQDVQGLKASTHYTWRVAAVNSGGQGPWSAEVGFTTAAAHHKVKA